MTIPEWRDEFSDGCSGAPLLSALPSARNCCIRHDERYYYGGSAADRLVADLKFRACLIGSGIPRWRVAVAFWFIRAFGGPESRISRVSWAFGGEVFAYTDRPAEPALAVTESFIGACGGPVDDPPAEFRGRSGVHPIEQGKTR